MAEQKEFPSDKADKFVVRFPDGMRDRIRADADKNDRSMNAEIIERLKTPDLSAAMNAIARLEASLGLCEANSQDQEVRILALSHFFVVTCNRLLENEIHPNDLDVDYAGILSTVKKFAASYKPTSAAESHAKILKATETLNQLLRASSKKELSLDSILAISPTEHIERETAVLNDIQNGLEALAKYATNPVGPQEDQSPPTHTRKFDFTTKTPTKKPIPPKKPEPSASKFSFGKPASKKNPT